MGEGRREKASRLRQELIEVQRGLAAKVEGMLGFRGLLRGSLYEWKRRCGARSCRCRQGELHRSWIWSYRKEGHVRKVSIREEELEGFRVAIREQQRYRTQSREVAECLRRMRAKLRDLEEALQIEPPHGPGQER